MIGFDFVRCIFTFRVRPVGHYHSVNLAVSICMHFWYIGISEVSFSDIMIFYVSGIMSHDTAD